MQQKISARRHLFLSLIHISTLNQYKYHPAIVISADVGSEVQCAADGIVSQIKVDEETGTTLTMAVSYTHLDVYKRQISRISMRK